MKFFSDLWTRFQDMFSGYPAWLPEVGIGSLVGLVSGFLTRTLGRYFVIALVTVSVVGFTLHYMGVITIHTMPLMRLLGVNRIPPPGELFGSLLRWIQMHLVATIAIILGFIVGWKFGK